MPVGVHVCAAIARVVGGVLWNECSCSSDVLAKRSSGDLALF